MNDKHVYVLAHPVARQRARSAVELAPEGYRVTIEPPKRKAAQNDRMHAMLGDIAKQCEFMGRKWDGDDWKRFLVDAFAQVMRGAGTPLHNDSRVFPSLDGLRTVQLGAQTAQFYVGEAAQFIEFLFSFGAERGVDWSEAFALEPA